MEAYIKVEHLTKKFKDNTVLSDVSLECRQGEIYGIIGYNGSGKSVFFKCLCGLEKQDSGKIMVQGEEKKPGELLSSVGIMIEEPAFLENVSGFKNLEYLYRIRNKMNARHISDTLRMVGLEPESKKKVGKYSLGMRQRLAIAQAVMEDPDILILDEPMNSLDKDGIEEMRKLFLELKERGKLILLASHNKDDIEILCDEVYEMDKGMLKQIQ